ncbi:hypothetical protein SRB5_30310 [Streptomyces sp. RB5]|uniref:Uncharacterized protein n=1 Tax=Streptomyces smaragdinus TaxID=2585196 RepID=A0A7K0CIP8_9ACTN|nr:hypothetical protein [Streptomyces smaragdinus]MQY12892.1 hypothetical protein [Streptomyces smaragdinus]
MSLLTKIGDAVLEKLVPEARAQAACVTCGTNCASYKQYKCVDTVNYVRCCYAAGGACSAPYCGSWYYCAHC